jgi:hypothetical protein
MCGRVNMSALVLGVVEGDEKGNPVPGFQNNFQSHKPNGNLCSFPKVKKQHLGIA